MPGTPEEIRNRQLKEALTPDHLRELYATSPTFHACIDTLAGMLPFMIQGLAVEAIKGEEEMQRRVYEAMTQSWTGKTWWENP